MEGGLQETAAPTGKAPMTAAETQEACLKGDLSRQWEWHEAFRDANKNMYRTTYQDTIHTREVSVKSQFPSGYGGHDATVKHDLLYKNTGSYKTVVETQALDPNRDTFPCFTPQKHGMPTYEKADAGATPTYGTLPDINVLPPWAVQPPVCVVPSHKTVPNMDVRKS